MGIDTGAAIIVGLKYEELMEHISEEQFEEFWSDGALISLSPWYDAEISDCAWGVYVLNIWEGSILEIDLKDLQQKVEKAKKEFYDLVGAEGKILFSADVT